MSQGMRSWTATVLALAAVPVLAVQKGGRVPDQGLNATRIWCLPAQ